MVFVVTLSLAINLVNATTEVVTGSIWTTSDEAGTLRTNEFVVGQTVYIFWDTTADSAHVEIYQRNGDNIGPLEEDLGTISDADAPAEWESKEGYYYILIPSEGLFPIAVSTIFVVPESLLGTVMATVACFAAFGAVFVVKRNRLR